MAKNTRDENNNLSLPNGEDAAIVQPVEQESAVFVASQAQLIWWKFRKHKLAIVSSVFVFLLYLVAVFAEFLAPFPATKFAARYTYAPPQSLHFFEKTADGLKWNPHVLGYKVEIDKVALRRTFVIDETKVISIRFFVKGEPYKLLGLIPMEVRLMGPVKKRDPMYLLGGDRLGRDVFSRLIYGTRLSMSIGLVGVSISLLLGVTLGGISGYYGGTVDIMIQRIIEFMQSMPTIPLWLGLSAALPHTWSPVQVYFSISIILSLISWTGMARVVRGRFLSLRQEEFVMAAKLDGSSELRIILLHMVPSFLSHIIASITLAIPHMILAETSLSFLGLGIRPPSVSWGVLLQEAQNVRAVITAPWLLLPAIAVITSVLALNFLGDGLRDAADPYH